MIKQEANFYKIQRNWELKRNKYLKNENENEKFSEIWNDARFNTM